jgi:hypothetical protein
MHSTWHCRVTIRVFRSDLVVIAHRRGLCACRGDIDRQQQHSMGRNGKPSRNGLPLSRYQWTIANAPGLHNVQRSTPARIPTLFAPHWTAWLCFGDKVISSPCGCTQHTCASGSILHLHALLWSGCYRLVPQLNVVVWRPCRYPQIRSLSVLARRSAGQRCAR